MNTESNLGKASPGEPGFDVSESSVGELLSEVTRDLSTLVRQEVELARAELRADAGRAGKAASMLGSAGLAGYLALLFLSCAVWWALANVMDPAWAALIVAAVWGVIAAGLYSVGRERLGQLRGMPRTNQTVKEIPNALKGNK